MPAVLDAFLAAVDVVADPVTFLILVVGALAGVLFGMLPGLGSVVALALFIPITFGMEPIVAFMFLAAVHGGVNQGGSITAILLNTPGYSASAATLLDGYPMTRDGRGSEAIAAAAVASALGALFGLAVLLLSLPVMIELVLLFSAPEIFWLGMIGIAVVASVVGDRILTGLISAGFGMIFAMYGLNEVTAGTRWTFGMASLLDGIPLIPPLIGLFAIAEMIDLTARGERISSAEVDVGPGKWKGAMAVLRNSGVFLRSAVIGTVIGIIPGVGATAATYVAYFQAKNSADDPGSFGKGDVRGVIAPESANDAKDGGAYIPTLGFGIPGSAAMAVLLGAFVLHGITPGPLLIQNHLDIAAAIILAALISNFVSSGTALLLVEQLVKVTTIDIRLVAPVVLSFTFLAGYADANNFFFVWLTLLFGLLGYAMKRVGMSRVPMVLGLVLAPIIEQNFFRSIQISRIEYWIFVDSTISKVLIVLLLVSLLMPYLQRTMGPGTAER